MFNKRKRLTLWIVNIIIGLIIIFPILYVLSISFMNQDEILSPTHKLIPSALRFDNYKQVVDSVPIFQFILNSFIVSLAITVGQIITSSLAAYAFVYFEFPGKRFLFLAVLSTMMIPGEAIIISNYLTVSSLEWLDSYKSLIIPYLASAMGIFMLRQYYLTVPKELKESAQIDGCSDFKFFLKILLPISKPTLGALGIYTFLSTWNQYMWPLLVTNTPEKRTVQIGISMLQFSESQSYGPILAGVVMILIPSIVIFMIGQKQMVKGIIAGAVKG